MVSNQGFRFSSLFFVVATRPRPPFELLEDRPDREPARPQCDHHMEKYVGRLGDDPFIGFASAGARELVGLLAQLLAHSRRTSVIERLGVAASRVRRSPRFEDRIEAGKEGRAGHLVVTSLERVGRADETAKEAAWSTCVTRRSARRHEID